MLKIKTKKRSLVSALGAAVAILPAVGFAASHVGGAVNTYADSSAITDANFLTCIRTSYTDQFGTAPSDPMTNAELAKVTNLGYYDVNGSNVFPCSHKNIHSVAGINLLTGLTFLRLNANSIETMDLSNNTALTRLVAMHMVDGGTSDSTGILKSVTFPKGSALKEVQLDNNVISSLNFSGVTGLDYVDARYNSISTVSGLSSSPSLIALSFMNNQLSSLDISGNPNLIALKAQNNPLNKLDISNNKAMYNLQLDEQDLVYTGVAPVYNTETNRFVYDYSAFNFLGNEINEYIRPVTGSEGKTEFTYDANAKTITASKEGIAQYGVVTQDTDPDAGSGNTDHSDIIDNHYLLELYGGVTYNGDNHASGAMVVPYPNYDGASTTIQTLVCSMANSASCSVTLPTIEREGYTLLGWADEATATEAKYDAGDTLSVNGYTEVYAVWAEDDGADTPADMPSDVPSTPNTGSITNETKLVASVIIPSLLPVIGLGIMLAVKAFKNKNSHRRFDI